MDESDPLYQYVRSVMVQIMAVLWCNGQTELHVGAMMRLLGVPEESAAQHDDERIVIDENFAQIVAELNIQHSVHSPVPQGVTIH
jgi:phosphatidylglycerophosphatase A